MTEHNKTPNGDDRQKALKEAFVKEIREELASDHSGKPSFEDFKKVVEKDRASRRKRRTAIAACFAVALLVGFFAFDMLASDVGADKNPKETIVTEDGVIIEDGGYGSSEYEDNVWVTEDWRFVKDAKTIHPGLLIPKYIPQGYEFKMLKLEYFNTGDMTYEYIFKNENGQNLEIEIFKTDNNLRSVELNDISNVIEKQDYKIYIQEKEKKATIQRDDGNLISIWYEVDVHVMMKIIEGL